MEATFTTQIRNEFAHHRQEWTRHYSHLFETLRQRGLVARLDSISRSSKLVTKEALTCLVATTSVLAEWALKLHTQERWSVAKHAVYLIDDFAVSVLSRLDLDRSGVYGVKALGQHGSKVRCIRNTLCRSLRDSGGRRPTKGQVFGRMLTWIHETHSRLTADVLVKRILGDKLPLELMELVKCNMADDEDREDALSARQEAYAKEESRILARAGVVRLDLSQRAVVRA